MYKQLPAWSLTRREEHRMSVFEKRVLREIFGAVREELAGGWKRLHNELDELYCAPKYH